MRTAAGSPGNAAAGLANEVPTPAGPKLALAPDMNCPISALPAQAPLPTGNIAGPPDPATPVAGPFGQALAQLLAALPRPVGAGADLGAAALPADAQAASSVAVPATVGRTAVSPALPPAAGQTAPPAGDAQKIGRAHV